MADFEVMGGKFTIKANDGHFSETYEIEAASMDDAMAQAKARWSERKGMRRAPSHAAAMATAHVDEMDAAAKDAPPPAPMIRHMEEAKPAQKNDDDRMPSKAPLPAAPKK